MDELRENNLIFLLGAGCSREAGIYTSEEMISEVERLIENEPPWQNYKYLYYFIKSGFLWSQGIFGKFSSPFNIENLLVIMGELKKRDTNILFPFIGAWNMKLLELAGEDFKKISSFELLIRNRLYRWITPRGYKSKSNYYKGFDRFKSMVGYAPIRIFSMNYDLCFEYNMGDSTVERGFNPRTFEWEESNMKNSEANFILYKLHGSVDWYLDQVSKKLMVSDQPEEHPELIFGTEVKLKSIDPYFFYTSQLREVTIHDDCKLVIAIGYSFLDEYVNDILAQSLKQKSNRTILSVAPADTNETIIDVQKRILSRLKLEDSHINQIAVIDKKAKEFLDTELTIENIKQYIKPEPETPFMAEPTETPTIESTDGIHS